MVPIFFYLPKRPQKGVDGLCRCVACGTLMTEQRYHCPECQEEVGPQVTTRLLVVVLCLLIIGAAAFFAIRYWM